MFKMAIADNTYEGVVGSIPRAMAQENVKSVRLMDIDDDMHLQICPGNVNCGRSARFTVI